ncbi:hypothetical protein [Rhodopirellula bahusiensis]|uniref:hypothetical protein n=1 Tax=Rhodopirellula bahusiensis TaxID=2014065 RepID=UPI001E6105BD|nr:hypothetical protein [Rhodopirellula bahusiensis]
MPVRTSIDVGSVTLPNERCEAIHLKLLRRLPNLVRVHSNRTLTQAEHRTIQNNVRIGTYLFYDVQTANGETCNLRSFRVGYHRVDQDTNGDGVIDEEDEIKWIRNP